MEKFHLSDELYIGKGLKKIVYTHPNDSSKCIKIVYDTKHKDMSRELAYRKMRDKKHKPSKLLPTYYGEVETNLGTGYVFERIKDFDGSTSKTLQDLFNTGIENVIPREKLIDVLRKFRDDMLKEEIITVTMSPSNFCVQHLSEEEIVMRIVDDIGVYTFISVVNFSSVLARHHVKKHWNRFIDNVKAHRFLEDTDYLRFGQSV